MLYDTIKREASEVRSLLLDFETAQSDWESTMEDSHGSKVMWKPSKDSPIHTLRLDGKVASPAFNVLAVLMEVDMYQNWIPTIMGIGLKKLDLLLDLDRYRKLVHVDMALPWPIANRDANMVGYGVDMLSQGRILAVARSYECAPEVPFNVNWSLFPEIEAAMANASASGAEGGNDEHTSSSVPAQTESGHRKHHKHDKHHKNQHKHDVNETPEAAPSSMPEASSTADSAADSAKLRDEIVAQLQKVPGLIPNPKSKIVRSSVVRGGFLLTPLENETQVSFLFQVDPKLAVVPTWLINWAMKHFSFAVLNLLAKASAKVGQPGDPYTKRMEERPEVYDYLKSRFEQVQLASPDEAHAKREEYAEMLRVPKPLHVNPDTIVLEPTTE